MLAFKIYTRRAPQPKHAQKISESDFSGSQNGSGFSSSTKMDHTNNGEAEEGAGAGAFSKSMGSESNFHNAKKSGFHTAHIRLPDTKIQRATAAGSTDYAKGIPSEAGLQDLQTKAKEAIMMRKEAKKRTLDELILQEVETELDKHYDITNYEGMMDTYGERSPTMTEITFEKRPLGMSFSKNHNGCFIVQSVSAQSKEKHVKVGDIIVGICDQRVVPTWSRHQVAELIRDYSQPDMEENLAIIFDRSTGAHR